MPMTMHAATGPVFTRVFTNMLAWLDKAEAHAVQRKFNPDAFLSTKLAPDMLPLLKQIQISTDTAKGCMARLAGVEVPSWPDEEVTMADARARIKKAIDYCASFTPAQIDGSDRRDIAVPMRNRDPLKFVGSQYVNVWALPNFYFHATSTYALLRHAGVELGKQDFLGGI
jgi:uncharacterized protein